METPDSYERNHFGLTQWSVLAQTPLKVLDDLLDRSVFIPPEQFEICQMQVSQCHKNASWLYRRGKGRIMTGYCLGKDGLWRSHSWLRAVVVAADALRAELTLFGSASAGERSGINDPGKLDFSEGIYTALLTLSLPLERTKERIAYRKSLIDLEQAVRNVQESEDEIKLAVRGKLRDMVRAREGLQIQALSVELAKKRVKSSDLFLQAGRIEIRDLLDSQEALLSAQNSFTSAIVDYRIAELELQRDIGLLEVNENGMWKEFDPTEEQNETSN